MIASTESVGVLVCKSDGGSVGAMVVGGSLGSGDGVSDGANSGPVMGAKVG